MLPIHIYLASPADTSERDAHLRLQPLLDATERARAARFRFPQHQHLYRTSHGLLRLALSLHEPATPPHAWRYRVGERGRPEIDEDAPRLRFNLSHTHGLIAIAITPRGDLGVDVEQHTRDRDLRGIAHRFFASAEHQPMIGMSDDAFRHRFFTLWTLKESYIKARGLGLAIPLHDFAFRFPTPEHIQLSTPTDDTPDGWRFALFSPTPTHRLALAHRDREHGDEAAAVTLSRVRADGSTAPLHLGPERTCGALSFPTPNL